MDSVSAISSTSQPISIAKPISPISSPALTPTMPQPITLCVSSSTSNLVKPSVRPVLTHDLMRPTETRLCQPGYLALLLLSQLGPPKRSGSVATDGITCIELIRLAEIISAAKRPSVVAAPALDYRSHHQSRRYWHIRA